MIDLAAEKKREVSTANVQDARPQFSKRQMVGSARYYDARDLVDALLEDGKKYTFETVDTLIENYKKGQMK